MPSGQPRGWRRAAMLAYALLRLPLLAALLYAWYGRGALERDLEGRARLIQFVFDLASTPLVRLLVAAVIVVSLGVTLITLRRRRSGVAHGTVVCVAALLFAALLTTTGQSQWLAAAPLLLILTNLPIANLLRTRAPALARWVAAAGVGLAEVFFLPAFIDWVTGARHAPRTDRDAAPVATALPALVAAAGVFSLSLSGPVLVDAERALRLSPQATVVARGDFNWIERDAGGGSLFVTGHGADRLRRYDLGDWLAAPAESSVSTGGAQGFAFDPAADEIYVYNTGTRRLLYFAASTLTLKRSVDVPGLSGGDPWIVVDAGTDTLLIVSENDSRSDTPFILLDRRTGAVLDRRDEDPGNVLKHPGRSLVYLAFFRRMNEIAIYDIAARAIAVRQTTPPHTDRLSFSDDAGEVLLASPVDASVLRFDAATLAPKGQFAANFGVRSLAVDRQRNLLLCGSIATGTVVVVDLASGRIRERHYLGPWLRTIALDAAGGIAYVSANGALYTLSYGR